MLRLIIFITTFLLFSPCVSIAQEFTPIVQTYDRIVYGADTQNWSVSASDDGVMYFGNGHGLLSFDGYRWQITRLPEGKLARTVFSDGDLVYVGSHEQFGYFSKSAMGTLEYHSLSDCIDDYEMQNDEIWRILKYNDRIIFQSFTSFFVYDGVNVTAHRIDDICLFFNICDGSIMTSADNSGMVTVDPDTGDLHPLDDVPFRSQMVSILPYSGSQWLILTYSDGLYLYDGENFTRFRTEIDRELPIWQPNNAIRTSAGDIVIGTKLNGAVCINSKGKLIWNLSNSNVLECNTVLGMDLDREGNLWLAMDGGLAKVNTDPSLSYIRSVSPSVGSIYTVFYRKPYLYLGTGQGLYRGYLDSNFKSLSDVSEIPEVLGNVWKIEDYDGQLICGTNYETFDISSGRASVLSDVVGGFCIDKGVINGKEVLVQGTYTNLCIYFRKNGRWEYSHSITDFMQPVNSIKIDYSGTIWAGHRYKGLYSIRLDSSLEEIESMNFHPTLDGVSERPVTVSSIGGRVIFLDGQSGFYTHDYINDRIVPFKELNEAMKDYPMTSSISHFRDDLYWFISASQATLAIVKDKVVFVEDIVPYSIFGSNVPDESHSVTPVSKDKCIIAVGNTLALYDASAEPDRRFSVPVLKVSSVKMSDLEEHKDSLLPICPADIPKVPYRYRNLTMEYLFPNYDETLGYTFSFSLDGNEWTGNSDMPSVSYAYLKRGRHEISARAQSPDGRILSENVYKFKVVYPFYMSIVSYVIYFILIAGVVIISVTSWIRMKRDKAMRKEKEALEAQVQIKSKELAASTLNLIQRNELLNRIRKEVASGNDTKAIAIIDGILSGDNDWQTFETNFDHLHARFFRNLRERYPSLTDNDLRFCAYLRLNLSSKDIASLMNISLKGVEAARARIRKKIGLSSSQSLTAFMIDLK